MKRIQRFAVVIVMALMLFPTTFAYAMEVPTNETCQEVNGRQLLTRIYSVSPELDPATLISSDFEKDGFVYTFDSIIKTEQKSDERKQVTKEYSIDSSTQDLSKNISQMPASLTYDENGYHGQLYLEPKSIETTVTGYHTTSHVVKSTVSYPGLEYNDPSLVPTTSSKNGTSLALSDLSWSEDAYLDDSSVPGTYTATATYKKTVYNKVANGYKVTAEYSGEVTKDDLKTIEYTITYLGSEIKEHQFLWYKWTEMPGEQKQTNAINFQAIFLNIITVLCGILLVLLLIFLIMKLVQAIRNMFVTIQAQDDVTGEYKTTQIARLKKSDPVIELNTMKSPGSRHYNITVPKKKAEAMKGKIITIHSPQQTFQHQIGDSHGNNYLFSIDFSTDSFPTSPSPQKQKKTST